MVLDDAQSLLSSLEKQNDNNNLLLGITSNTPIRHMESVLPMLDSLHDRFSWFTCSQEVGHEKPSPEIFEDTYQQAKFWLEETNKNGIGGDGGGGNNSNNDNKNYIEDAYQQAKCFETLECDVDNNYYSNSNSNSNNWHPLQKDEILHIGDSYTCDYCGAKAFGFQALLLDRSDHPSVTAYQDWLEAPDYPGKSLEDVQKHTITSLEEVASMLQL